MPTTDPPRPSDGPAPPTVVAIAMGYGHLRPAHALAEHLGTPVLHADRPPLAGDEESARWRQTRHFYEVISRLTSAPVAGRAFRAALDGLTTLPPLHPFRDLSGPTLPVHLLSYWARRGLGRELVAYLEERRAPLLTTFHFTAFFANHHGYDPIHCVVTDADVQRVWVAAEPRTSRVRYFAPSARVVRRLRAYGVPPERIDFTGFPLPHSLTGGPSFDVLHANLRARLARLDPKRVFRNQYLRELEPLGALADATEPPRLTFAVGGAGAQADHPARFLPSLAPLLREGRLRLALVAGAKAEVAATFRAAVEANGLSAAEGSSVEILFEPDLPRYFERFNELMARTDVLWTKPSELVFFGGLGLPLLFSPAVGRHEEYNQRWVMEHGAGLAERRLAVAAHWLAEWLEDGTLAAAAWSGFKRLPHRGLYQIAERLSGAGPRTTVTPPPP